jgi:uncharacterized protein YecA (UPF0149 family)
MKIKISQIKQKLQQAATNIKDLPRVTLMANFSNELKHRQLKCIAEGNPITEQELIEGLAEDWKGTGFVYRRAGITFEDLVVAGKLAIADTSGTYELPKMAQWIVDKVGRNQPCPCGSGKKYKKCCGRG